MAQHGGARKGAGRKPKSGMARAARAVRALQCGDPIATVADSDLRGVPHRVREGTPPALVAAAGEALAAIHEIVLDRTDSRARLAAAVVLREEICGAVPKPMTLSAPGGGPVRLAFALDLSEPARLPEAIDVTPEREP